MYIYICIYTYIYIPLSLALARSHFKPKHQTCKQAGEKRVVVTEGGAAAGGKGKVSSSETHSSFRIRQLKLLLIFLLSLVGSNRKIMFDARS